MIKEIILTALISLLLIQPSSNLLASEDGKTNSNVIKITQPSNKDSSTPENNIKIESVTPIDNKNNSEEPNTDSSNEKNIDSSENNSIDLPESKIKNESNDNINAEIVFPKSDTSLRQSMAKKIFDKMRSCNDSLEDYSCPIKAKAKVKYAFVSVPFNIEGNYYFKQPDKYAVKFTKAPDFLSKYPQAFGWCIPDASKYSIRYFDGEEEFSDCFMLRMVPIEGRGDILKIDMWINKSTWMFPRQIYTYKNGGEVDIRCFYRQMDSFSLFDKMTVTLTFPSMGIKGSGEAEYGEYKINSGLDDEIFKDSSHK